MKLDDLFKTKLSETNINAPEGLWKRIENNLNNLCMDVCLRKGRKRRGMWIPLLVDAEVTAQATGTIPYEVLCAATRRAEIVYDYD